MNESDVQVDAEAVVSSAGDFQGGMNDENVVAMSSVKEVYCCPYLSCNFSTAWKSSLNMHMKTHTG